MPPVVRYTRDAVLSAAYELVRRDGLSAFNARSVAQELGSSTQPIFRLFSGMDELRAGVMEMAREKMTEYMLEAVRNSDTPYLTSGFSYVRFAQDEPELFKSLFIHGEGIDVEQMRPVPDELIGMIQQLGEFTVEQAKTLHGWLWVFTHGLAVSIATKSLTICENRLRKVLMGAYEAATLKLRQDIQEGIV